MSTIVLNEKALMFMGEYLESHMPSKYLPASHVIFENYKVILDPGGIAYQAENFTTKESDRQLWMFTLFNNRDKKTPICVPTSIAPDGEFSAIKNFITGEKVNFKGSDTETALLKFSYLTHSWLFSFLAIFSPDLRGYTEKQIEVTRKKPNGKTKKQTVTHIALWKYISDVQSGKKHLSRNKCAFSFGVRGHYRHYKSGKVVFIHPYEKNRDKTQCKDTTYVFPRIKKD